MHVLIANYLSDQRKPCKTYNRMELKRGSRRTLNTIRKTINNNRYRKDLKMVGTKLTSCQHWG